MRTRSILSAGIGVVRLPQPYSVATRRRGERLVEGKAVGNLAGPLLRRARHAWVVTPDRGRATRLAIAAGNGSGRAA